MIAAAIITRDGEQTLAHAVGSVAPFVDEVCVYDTGSTDGTMELARGLGCRVTAGEWRDDYAWAREQSYAMTEADWLIWLDDDELLIRGDRLRAVVAAAAGADIDYLYVQNRNRDDLSSRAVGRLRVRLAWRTRISLGDRLRWSGAVHEVLECCDAERELAFGVVPPDELAVVHSPADVDGRHDHYEATLQALEDPRRPPRYLRYLGLELINRGELVEAITTFRRYLEETAGQWSQERLTVLGDLARCLMEFDVAAGVAAIEEAKRERQAWAQAVAAGECSGEARLGPDFFARLPKVIESRQTGRNDPCWCGSGRRTKRCHPAGFPVVVPRLASDRARAA